MSEPLLNVKNLSVDVEEKSILHGISLTINKGETHVLHPRMYLNGKPELPRHGR